MPVAWHTAVPFFYPMNLRTLLPWFLLSLSLSFQGGCSADSAPAKAGVPVAQKPAGGADDLITVSGVTSPSVGYALSRRGDELVLVVDAVSFEPGGTGVSVRAGLSADKTVMLDESQAKISRKDSRGRFEFVIPSSRLMASDDGWKKLRLAFSVEWAGGPFGQPRLRERFLHVTPGAPHAGLSANTADWQPVDLVEMERQAADRALQIHFDFNQPMDGKATVVIEDAAGHRVRNLISGQPMTKGRHRLEWDGLDEAGSVVPPADYRWRSISHPGLRPVYQFSFVDAPGSNHATFEAAASNANSVFLAAPVTEGGYEMIELTPEGTFKRGFNFPNGHGLGGVALALDDRFIYVAHDGTAWGEKTDYSKPGWKQTRTLSVLRLDLEKGEVAEFPGRVRYSVVKTYDVGPGTTSTRPLDESALAGIAALDGHLYLADRSSNRVVVIDPATGKPERSFALEKPTALAAGNGKLYALADGKLLQLAPATGATKVLATPAGRPAGLWVAADGRFYVSDAQVQVVRVLDAEGRPATVIGTPGGIALGPYDPQKMQNPAGLTVAKGLVWVTEKHRWQPKRLAAYDTQTGRMAKEFFGPTNYGSQGAGFDPADDTRWIGQGALFKLDFTAHTSTPLSILGGETGRRHTFWRQDGRTFIITSGKATWIQELRADGTLRPLACISSAHQFSYENNWTPPQAFVDAFMRDYPTVKIKVGQPGGIQRIQPNHGYGMLWVDRNGDGAMQAEEIEFSTAATNLAGSGWSHDFHDLTLRVPAEVAGRKVLVTLKPDGWWPGGAPKYPALNEAAKAGVPIDLPGSNQVESAVDGFGNMVLNSSPDMRAFAPDGRLLWTYPNKWSGVHGSHDAPLPHTGELQGALFFSGVVALDAKADVMLLNGNHGRAFVLTSDGLYLDEMFPDVRMMTNPQAGGIGILGGECFGGTFGRSEKDGNYYFQGGGISYRIYRIDGLRDTQRAEGTLAVSAAQSAAAERSHVRLVTDKTELRQAVIGWCATPPLIDGKDNDWLGTPTAAWSRDGKFAVTVRAAVDAGMLYLHYTVRDESPWVNNGKDWQALFKTGDGIDLQLGTDPTANPKRSTPVPGDLRLFIAPMGQDNVAVLYRHRVPGAKETDGVIFQSPWRSEKVDVVRRLDLAKIAVQRESNLYRIEVAVPLADLGLTSAAGLGLHGDFGVIYGDGQGTVNVFRNYWSNQATGLVNDVPGEIMLSPNAWGELTFGSPANAPIKETAK